MPEEDLKVPAHMLVENALASFISEEDWEKSPARSFNDMVKEIDHKPGSAAETVETAVHGVWRWMDMVGAPPEVREMLRIVRMDGVRRAQDHDVILPPTAITAPPAAHTAAATITAPPKALKAEASFTPHTMTASQATFKDTLAPLPSQPRASRVLRMGGLKLPTIDKYCGKQIDTKNIGLLYFQDGAKAVGCMHANCRTYMSKPYISLSKGPSAIHHVFCWVSNNPPTPHLAPIYTIIHSHCTLCTHLHPQKPQGEQNYPSTCAGIIPAEAHKYMEANIEALEREVAGRGREPMPTLS